MMMARRFVNMVVANKSAVCSVHRLNVSEHLFYPSTAEAEATKPEVSRLRALPAPTASFQTTPHGHGRGQHELFALVSPRSGESRILWSSPSEVTVLHDVDSHSISALPSLRYKGYHPIVISIAGSPDDAPEEDLYVMSSAPASPYASSFQVLRCVRRSNPRAFPNLAETWSWQWETLPPPPLPQVANICSHAVLDGGRTICVTAAPHGDAGTYFFDTVDRQWVQAPEDWDLPFFGGAEYLPDHKLWLGLDWENRHRLCAFDLSAGADKPPALSLQWEDGVETPEQWRPVKGSLVNLGEGRFCVFKIILDKPPEGEWDDLSDQVDLGRLLALLTGVEIKSSSSEGRLSMVTHKSLCYNFIRDEINWVL